MNKHTPAQLALARRIAADDARQQYPNFGADILAGHCDDAPRVRCALAALEGGAK